MSRKNVLQVASTSGSYQSGQFVATVLLRMMQATGAKTQTELASHLEIGKAAISDAKRRNILPAEWFLKLCRPPWGINPLWLETGQGPMRMQTPDQGASLAESAPLYGPGRDIEDLEPPAEGGREAQAGSGSYIVVPVARQRLLNLCEPAASLDARLEVGKDPARFRFHKDWLCSRGDPRRMRLLRIMGDAMRPTLLDGDLVLLDEAQKDIFEGSLYVLAMDGQVLVKRLAKRLGSLLLISENREHYEPLEVPFPSESLQVVGRVVWLSREL